MQTIQGLSEARPTMKRRRYTSMPTHDSRYVCMADVVASVSTRTLEQISQSHHATVHILRPRTKRGQSSSTVIAGSVTESQRNEDERCANSGAKLPKELPLA